jgi:hypothetical protein
VFLTDHDASDSSTATRCVPLHTLTDVARDVYYVTKTLAELRKLIPVP